MMGLLIAPQRTLKWLARNPGAPERTKHGLGPLVRGLVTAAALLCGYGPAFGAEDGPWLIESLYTVTAGYFHSCALDASGVHCWGHDGEGWARVPPLVNPTHVAAGNTHTCALDAEGVACWGIGYVPRLSNPTQIVSSGSHSCTLDDNGVTCWGSNYSGQTDVPPLSNPTQIAAGDATSCAIDDSGVTCWGQIAGSGSPPHY